MFALPALLTGGDRPMLPIGLASAMVLFVSWSARYLRRNAPWWMDVVDAVA